MNYVIHFCKNKSCNNAWLDLDVTNAKSVPPKWKYCDECCDLFGYVNTLKPPKRKNYLERIKRIEKYRFNAKRFDENEKRLSA